MEHAATSMFLTMSTFTSVAPLANTPHDLTGNLVCYICCWHLLVLSHKSLRI